MDNVIDFWIDPINPLKRAADYGKVIAGYFDEDGQFQAYVGSEMDYKEKLFALDTFEKMIITVMMQKEFMITPQDIEKASDSIDATDHWSKASFRYGAEWAIEKLENVILEMSEAINHALKRLDDGKMVYTLGDRHLKFKAAIAKHSSIIEAIKKKKEGTR